LKAVTEQRLYRIDKAGAGARNHYIVPKRMRSTNIGCTFPEYWTTSDRKAVTICAQMCCHHLNIINFCV
jgi:hypothetical protein